MLCLDVEGMEVEVLRGLDLARYAPRYVCVEVRDRKPIEALLGERYRLVEWKEPGADRELLSKPAAPS